MAMATTQIPSGLGIGPVTTSTDIQTAFVQEIVAAAVAAPPLGVQSYYLDIFTGSPRSATLTTPILLDTSEGVGTIDGSASVSSAEVLLGTSASYTTDGTQLSVVAGADSISAQIINNTPGSGLIAVTGASQGQFGDTLEGLAGVNQFVTGNNGRDAVLLDGVVNNLTSNGDDVVLVGGPSTITAASNGMDAVTMTAGTTLAFFSLSNSSTVDSITGAANGIVLLAGYGSTSITAGPGPEYAFVDTSAGNVTLNANSQSNAAFTFIKDASVGTAAILVNNFTTNDIVAIHGYTGFTVQPSAGNAGGSVLALSDGSQVTFSNVSATALQQAVRTV